MASRPAPDKALISADFRLGVVPEGARLQGGAEATEWWSKGRCVSHTSLVLRPGCSVRFPIGSDVLKAFTLTVDVQHVGCESQLVPGVVSIRADGSLCLLGSAADVSGKDALLQSRRWQRPRSSCSRTHTIG